MSAATYFKFPLIPLPFGEATYFIQTGKDADLLFPLIPLPFGEATPPFKTLTPPDVQRHFPAGSNFVATKLKKFAEKIAETLT